jgi:transcriptional regulator with XRE-family HTH domain
MGKPRLHVTALTGFMSAVVTLQVAFGIHDVQPGVVAALNGVSYASTVSVPSVRLPSGWRLRAGPGGSHRLEKNGTGIKLGFSQLAEYPGNVSSIGGRVLQRLEQLSPRQRHRDIAERIGMTPDSFSRALNGKRQFASIELARLAEQIGADLHWLITGQPDPNRLSVAARHDYDHSSGQRTVPGRAGDEPILADIALAYRQAYPEPGKGPDWPGSPTSAREALGPDFVRPFADRLEKNLGIDVVRVAELSTAYSFTVGGRPVIAVPATGNWFRENWDIAHELGHLVMGHHDDGLAQSDADQHEAAANAFAAEFLLPAADLKSVEWDSVGDEDLAVLVWSWGVSTDALCRRLCAVLGYAPEGVARWAAHPTQRLLRRHLKIGSELDEITTRMDAASQRRFPLSLQEAHLERIASGVVSTDTLAWMLGIDAAALEVDSPDVPEVDVDDLASALGL